MFMNSLTKAALIAPASKIRLVLPWPVSANRYWSTAVMKGRAVTFVTKQAKEYKQRVKDVADMSGLRAPIDGRVSLTINLFPARPADWAKRSAKSPIWDDTVRCIDLDNALKVTLDALKNIAFHDDAWVRKITAERFAPDAHGARVEVTVESWDGATL
jgi:crossover junction endodeoxyribonuclease RusA